VQLPVAFAAAFRADAIGSPADAVRAYLDVVRAAAPAARDPWQLATLQASLDALATRSMPSLGEMADDASLARRTRETGAIVDALVRALPTAQGPFARGLVARALETLARHDGNAANAELYRSSIGCAREALVVGPMTWTPISGVHDPDPFDKAGVEIRGAYSIDDAFGTQIHPIAVRDRGCHIELSAENARPGVKDVIVDVEVPRAQTVGLVLRAHGAAELRSSGVRLVERPFELGDGEAARFVRVAVRAGTLRLVARVGTAKDSDTVEIDAFGADGEPLRSHGPTVGSAAADEILGVQAESAPRPATDDEALATAASAMAAGDPRSAERVLWRSVAQGHPRPDLALVYGRSLETARDLSPAMRAERARGAYERVAEAWPGQWEAAVASAVLAGVRRGRDEAGLEVLRAVDAARGVQPAWVAALVDAFDAAESGRQHLFDRAGAALARAGRVLGGTSLLADATRIAFPRSGPESVAVECDPGRASARDSLACLEALRDVGDREGELRELARLRTLFGAPSRFLGVELHEALAYRDQPAAVRAFTGMLPAERTLNALALLAPPSSSPATRALLEQLALAARDSPEWLGPLMAALGSDAVTLFDGRAERIAAENRANAILPSAATAVLAHDERYEVSPLGLVHWTLFDLRRVSGTTDVEENPSAPMPEIWGRATTRTLRRRILKKDGSIVEPEKAPHASQAHAELSQLEQGDLVEAIYEGYALPGDTRDVGIDTPDLLSDRSAVKDATIQIRLPRRLAISTWVHPLLGKPAERTEGDARVLEWHMTDQAERLIEDRVPRMDRNVCVSLTTMQWSTVGRALRETLAALDEHDPEIAAWASEAAGKAPAGSRAAVDAVVAAAGQALREGDSDVLSDYGGGITAIQDRTARGFLSSHEGSRSWLVVRALRELGIASSVVVAEEAPYSADPNFPPHFARFVHPLVVAHVPAAAGSASGDVWIDSDVSGPALPAGRVSPELRGRLALFPDSTIRPLPARTETSADRDEADIRLTLDERGDARGTFTVALQGRGAQELGEALIRTVGAERQRALRDVVLAWLPWADVDDVTLASAEGSWNVSLRAQIAVSGYAQSQGDTGWLLPGMDTLHWAWPRARVSSLGATFAAHADRESALALSAAVQYHLHRRVELPPHTVVARLPGPVRIHTSLIDASRDATAASLSGTNAIDEDFSLSVSTGTIGKADYPAFVGAAHAIDDGFLASTRIAAEPKIKAAP
jgi:hypothetical protein